jgi:hypothetical protein
MRKGGGLEEPPRRRRVMRVKSLNFTDGSLTDLRSQWQVALRHSV